jgi:hypothetical protein
MYAFVQENPECDVNAEHHPQEKLAQYDAGARVPATIGIGRWYASERIQVTTVQ